MENSTVMSSGARQAFMILRFGFTVAPILAGLLWAMRGSAPTHLRAAGLVAGKSISAAVTIANPW